MTDLEATDPRVATVFRLLEAYRHGDLELMQREMAVDVTLEAIGDNPLAGTYQGVGGVLAFIGKSMGTFVTGSVDVQDVETKADEVHVIVAGEMALVHAGTAKVRILQRYWFGDEGKIARIRAEAADDQEEFDRLLTEQARLL
jgi:ketosteroid isomerase-like protein